MTFLQAINHTEDAATRLGLKDRLGDPIYGIEALGVVGGWVGADWDSCLDRLDSGAITPDQYAAEMLGLIDRFERTRFSARVDSLLGRLKRDQIELDLGASTSGRNH